MWQNHYVCTVRDVHSYPQQTSGYLSFQQTWGNSDHWNHRAYQQKYGQPHIQRSTRFRQAEIYNEPLYVSLLRWKQRHKRNQIKPLFKHKWKQSHTTRTTAHSSVGSQISKGFLYQMDTYLEDLSPKRSNPQGTAVVKHSVCLYKTWLGLYSISARLHLYLSRKRDVTRNGT